MKKVYVVFGSTGEYSDYREWWVAYYFDEALAKNHAELAGAEDRRIAQWIVDHDYDSHSQEAKRVCVNKWDPAGISYRYSNEVQYSVGHVEPGRLKKIRRLLTEANAH